MAESARGGRAVQRRQPLDPLDLTVTEDCAPEERAARAAIEKAEAEKRLVDAEARLREAIEELHEKNNHVQTASQGSNLFCGRHPLCMHGDSCVANAVSSLCQSFMLAYGVRVGIGVLLRAFKLARKRPYYSFLDLKLLLAENNLMVREEACRTGLLFGGFTGSFHAIRCFLRRKTNADTPLNVFVAGSVAGLSVLALEDAQRRRTFALYLLARLAQCTYNSAKAKNKFHFWGSQWQHGDTLLFSLACAQIMYAVVMRPETLPEAYLDFIVKTGPVSRQTLQAVRESCRRGDIDVDSLSQWVASKTGRPMGGVHRFSSIIPCHAVHPDMPSCLAHNSRATRATFKKTFPLYLALTFVPFVVLNIQKFMQAPIHTFWNSFKDAIRSTCFLSVFVGAYQGFICVQRKIMTKDHKSVYFIAGAFAALSTLLEKKSRRSELALYTLPRAADSLWYIMVNRHFLPDIKYAEVALFCLCMGGVMYYHEYEPVTMAPFLRGLIRRFLNRTGTPDQTSHLDPQLKRLQLLVRSEESLQPDNLSTVTEDGSVHPSTSGAVADPSKDPSQASEKLHAEAFQGL